MNSIKKILRTDSFMYVAFAFSIATAAFFIVLPQVSDIGAPTHGPSFAAGLVAAFGGDGGGDGGGGGDPGGGCCGDGGTPTDPGTGGGGGGTTPTAPVCTLSVAETTLVDGQSTTLGWTTIDATSASLSPGFGAVALNGSKVVSPTVTTKYTLTVTNAVGSTNCVITVTVDVPPSAPTCTLTATPASITSGQSATLSWTTQNATNVSLNQNIGAITLNGSKSVSPTTNTTYTLTATGAGGTVSCTGSITVTYPPSTNSCTEFGFDFDIAKYDWNGTGYTKTAYRNDYVTSGSGSQSVATWASAPGASGIVAKAGTTFKIITGGTAGTVRSSEIGAGQNGISHFFICGNIPAPSAPTCTLTATPASITSGQTATLSWTTTNATNVSLNQNIGAITLNGSKSVSPTTNTTYTLTATGAGGTVSCSAPVTVIPVIPGQCVLEITKSANTSTAKINDTLTYTLNFKNIGTVDCTGGGVRIVDQLPAQVQYISETHSGNVTAGYGSTPVYESSSHTMSWNGDVLTPGESGLASVTVKVKERTTCGNYSFDNTAKITSAEYNNFGTWIYSNAVKTDVTNTCQEPAPTCTLTATPASITSGQSATLSWTTTNATNVSLNQNIGAITLNGSKSVSPTTNTTYTLTATGAGGTVTCSAPVTVIPVISEAPVCTLDAAPLSIIRGQSATLSWTTLRATTISLDQGVGVVSATGTRTVSPTVNTTYTLTATNEGGIATCVKTITVTEPEPGPLTCDAFTAAPGTLNAPGTTTLTWATTNAASVTISNGVGIVTEDGSKSVFVNANTTYTLTAVRGTEVKTCTATVAVVPDVVVPRCDAFTVSPSTVKRGASVTLAWDTTNATNVSINPTIGSVSADGSRTATIDANTTFVLTAGNGAATTSCQASVSVESSGGGGGGGGGGSSGPRCTLKASDTSIKSGEKVTLSWKNTRTSDILLKDNRGNVIADSKKDTKIDEDADTIDVRPAKSTAYTLTALNGSKKRTCTVDINVENVSVSSTRTRDPLVAGISLSRVPYTGFDAGPLLTAFFYSLLIIWALAVAYMLVIRREPVLGISLKSKKTPIRGFIPTMQKGVSATTAESSPVIELPMRTIPAPRTIPAGEMASKNAAQGYEQYYAGASLEEMQAEVIPKVVEHTTTHSAPNFELLEARAHDARMLISTDALRFITAQSGTEAEHIELLDMIIGAAKVQYPKEDGWVVINKERILGLLK